MNLVNRLDQSQLEVISVILNEGEVYTHCEFSGRIFSGEYEVPLIDLEKMTGLPEVPQELADRYIIHTGSCPKHRILLSECSGECELSLEEIDYRNKHDGSLE